MSGNPEAGSVSSEPGRRRYESIRRTAQAQQTRAEIARAARTCFVAQGWSGTTVRDVAREAGVSVPTVYAAYGNKTGLVRAVADAADLSADTSRMLTELENCKENGGEIVVRHLGNEIEMRAGRAYVEARHSWRASREKLDGLLEPLLAGDRMPAGAPSA